MILFPVNEIIEHLKAEEGVKKFAYRCTNNKITIGVGRNIDANGGIGLSESEIDFLLTNDIERVLVEAKTFDWFTALTQTRQVAIVSLIFQLGLPRYKLFKKHIQAMSQNNFTQAAAEILDSRFAKQVPARSQRIAAMIERG